MPEIKQKKVELMAPLKNAKSLNAVLGKATRFISVLKPLI